MRRISSRWLVHTTALVTILEAFLQPTFAASGDRNEQWLYRVPSTEPVAVFMDWNYSNVVFRISCARHTLAIRYFGDKAVKLKRGDPMTLILDSQEHKLAVTFDKAGLEGRIALSPALSASIAVAKDVDIHAPNEMGEPWYTGSAPALKRVVKECR